MFGLFVLVTLFNLWVIQTSVIVVALMYLQSLDFESVATLALAKGLGIAVSLVCNYLAYRRICT